MKKMQMITLYDYDCKRWWVMKTFKQFVEKAPNTSDAMKRYKSGKAGFTDKAHLTNLKV